MDVICLHKLITHQDFPLLYLAALHGMIILEKLNTKWNSETKRFQTVSVQIVVVN